MPRLTQRRQSKPRKEECRRAWAQQPRSQAEQAALDLGVQFDMKLLSPETDSLPTTKMAVRIRALCREGVDGLFVSIPSHEEVVPAIEECLALEVPIVSVNTGEAASRELGLLHHIGQIEYVAVFGGGQRLIASGMTHGLCPLHEVDNVALRERCEGFAAAISSSDQNITYLGTVNVERDRKELNLQAVEAAIGQEGEWDGVGILALGDPVVEEAVQLKERHANVLVGTFDTNELVFDAMNQGALLFGIDQNLYLQGTVPVWLLTLYATTRQKLVNFNIETGPAYVEQVAPPETIYCVENLFEICAPPFENDMNQLTAARPWGLVIAGISLVASLCIAGWVVLQREHSQLQSSQPVFLVMVCAGVFVLSSSIIPMSLDNEILSPYGCSIACMRYVRHFLSDSSNLSP